MLGGNVIPILLSGGRKPPTGPDYPGVAAALASAQFMIVV
jgi:hypothetical protein